MKYTRQQAHEYVRTVFPDASYELVAFESLGDPKWRITGFVSGDYNAEPLEEIILERKEEE